MYGDWIIAKASVIGNRHLETELPCQDFHEVYWDDEKEYGIAVVSDGAGSAANSHIGSEFVVKTTIGLLKSTHEIESFYTFITKEKSEIEHHFVDLFSKVHSELEQYANTANISVKSLASTVIVTLYSKTGIICGHIGDGRAGYQDMNNEWHPILWPFKGQYANQTIFITSEIWDQPEKFIRNTVVNNPIQSFTLMTDGCEKSAYELVQLDENSETFQDKNRPFSGFFNPNISSLRKLAEEHTPTEKIDNMWAHFLTSGTESLMAEPDDKTMILGTLKSQVLHADQVQS